MELIVEAVDGVAVVTLPVEELDASNAGDLKAAIAPAVRAYQQVVLDLGRLRFVDSSGLGAILSCLRQLSARGGDLKLCGLSRPVRAVLELVRMDRVFDIQPDRAAAVRAFGG